MAFAALQDVADVLNLSICVSATLSGVVVRPYYYVTGPGSLVESQYFQIRSHCHSPHRSYEDAKTGEVETAARLLDLCAE